MNKDIKYIIDKIKKSNGNAYIVGGSVRDMLIGIDPADCDIVTNLKPEQLKDIFKDDKCKLVGETFGVTMVNNIEISTYRHDKYVQGVHKKGADSVEYADTLEEDLERRDLTINAMAYDTATSDIIDPFNGRRDLNNKIIRFVGDPYERIKEDPCRLLRACRFLGKIDGRLDKQTWRAMISLSSRVQLVAKERIRIELLKMMELKNAYTAIEAMRRCHVLQHVLFPLYNCVETSQNKYHVDTVYVHSLYSMQSVSPRKPLLRLATMLHDIGKPACKELGDDGEYHFLGHEYIGADLVNELLSSLKFAKNEITYVKSLISNHMFRFEDTTKDGTYRRFMSKVKVPVRDVLRMRIADRAGNRSKVGINYHLKETLRRIRKIEKDDKALHLKDLAIDGDTIRDVFHIPPGPIYSKILHRCLRDVIDKPEKNSVKILLEIARDVLKNNVKSP